MLSFGTYPVVSLKEARDKMLAARKILDGGRDPSFERMADRKTREVTFEIVAREWLALQEKALSAVTLHKAHWVFESLLFPDLGQRPIAHISAPELLETLRRIEERGHNETARRAKQRCSQVFRYAIATGRAQQDVAVHLRGALAPVVTRSHAAITEPERIGALLRAIHGYGERSAVGFALRLAPLSFVRPGELRAAEWSEIDFNDRVWRIAAQRMKMREAHSVPLSRQAYALMRDLHDETGGGRFLFPSTRTIHRPMSENAINASLRSLGYSNDEMTGHGFRAMASTRLNELGWAPDLIELQLAHSERDKVRAVYNRAARLEERRTMMQAWADYLDSLRFNVVHAVNPQRQLGQRPATDGASERSNSPRDIRIKAHYA
jgi:integrase